MLNTVDIMNKGMQCLVENIGVLEAEQFISVIMREKFDYTKWQREFYDHMDAGEFHKRAVEYAKEHPYKGTAERL
ncbi:MAG: hypothetical protein IJ859_04620 [Synergistaceae bacterium]|nr:hypothetical protein [Synergistaceae bacterium]